ncbi:MAG: immunoglobulin-like domain-containing protein, partial [Patescibacteria group bacterium]
NGNPVGLIENYDVRGIVATAVRAIQELDAKINQVASGQQNILGANFDMQNKDIVNVRNILSQSGNWSISEEGKLVVKEIETEKLTVKGNGITIYDRITGEPVCVFSENSILKSESGSCNSPSPYEGEGGGEVASSTASSSDIIPPTIEILGNNPAEILVGFIYSDNGAIVTDNIDSNLGYQTYLNGVLVTEIQLDTSTTTIHSIEYKATDSAGNMGSAMRVVNVIE